MTCYETLFVVQPALTEEEIKSEIAKIVAVVEGQNAEIVAINEMGMKKLAYLVQKNSRGYYTVLFYKGEGSIINEIERNLKINENVIKFLTVKYTNTKEMAQFNKMVSAASAKEVVEEIKAPVVEETPVVEEAVEAPVVETPVTETEEATTEK
jgi:small subunit ribosomal protein S6